MLYAVEPFADDFTGVGNQDERARFHLFNVLPQHHRLIAAHNGKYNLFFFMGEGAFRVAHGCAASKLVHDKITDGFRIAAHHVKIFAHIDALNDVVDHQGFGK